MAKLMTPSLISSVSWLKKCPASWKEKAYKDLYGRLAREPYVPSEEATRGEDFEKSVVKVLEEINHDKSKIPGLKYSAHFKEVLNMCAGGTFQKKTKGYIQVDGVSYYLFGFMDVMHTDPDRILDLKTTENYRGPDKYLGTAQHKIYCYNEKIRYFRYLVTIMEKIETDKDGNKLEKPKYKIIENEKLDYKVECFDKLKEDLTNQIRETIQFIRSDEELSELYDKTYNKYG